jgi:hypothetical protein
MGFVVDKVALEQVFRVFRFFPHQFAFHRLLHHHHLSSGAGTIGQTFAAVPSGLSLNSREKNSAPQIPHDLIYDRNEAAALGRQLFIARTKARTSMGSCKNGNEPSGYVKGGKCCDKLSHSQLVKKGLVL